MKNISHRIALGLFALVLGSSASAADFRLAALIAPKAVLVGLQLKLQLATFGMQAP